MLDLLPLELQFYIFKMVDINEYFKLRLVCKRFKHLISEVKIDELVLMESDDHYNYDELIRKRKWFLIDKTLTNVVNVKSKLAIKFLESNIFNFKFLKRLMVHSSIDHKELTMDNLLQFEKLEHLEFDYLIGESILCLPNLRTFRQHTLMNGSLTIDSPNLTYVHIKYGLADVKIENPLAVKHFETLELTDYLFKFVNLERICVDHCRFTEEQSIVREFPNLKEIKFDLIEYTYSNFMDTMEVLRNLVEEKNKLNRNDLLIIFNNKEIKNVNQINGLQPEDFYSDTSGDSDFPYSDSYDSEGCFFDDDHCDYESDNSITYNNYDEI